MVCLDDNFSDFGDREEPPTTPWSKSPVLEEKSLSSGCAGDAIPKPVSGDVDFEIIDDRTDFTGLRHQGIPDVPFEIVDNGDELVITIREITRACFGDVFRYTGDVGLVGCSDIMSLRGNIVEISAEADNGNKSSPKPFRLTSDVRALLRFVLTSAVVDVVGYGNMTETFDLRVKIKKQARRRKPLS